MKTQMPRTRPSERVSPTPRANRPTRPTRRVRVKRTPRVRPGRDWSIGALRQWIRAQVAAVPRLYWMLGTMVTIVSLLGVLMVASASFPLAQSSAKYGNDPNYFFNRQAIFLVGGFIAMWAISLLPMQRIKQLIPVGLLSTLVLLVIALLVTNEVNVRKKADRWIDLGFSTLQPAELAKLTAVLFVASVLGSLRNLDDWRSWLYKILAGVGAMLVLIKFQPDHGSVVLIGLIVVAMVFVAGVRLGWLGVLALASLPVMWFLMFEGYHADRWALDPRSGAEAQNFQLRGALTGIHLGGWFGASPGASVVKWGHLPEAHTDEIFAVICEEFGFIGGAAVVILLAVLVGMGFEAARRSRDKFSRLVAVGISTWIALQALVNIGVATGVMPNKGFTLPFISYGGTSLFVMMTAAGVLMSVARGSRA